MQDDFTNIILFYVIALFSATYVGIIDECHAQATTTSMYDVILVTVNMPTETIDFSTNSAPTETVDFTW